MNTGIVNKVEDAGLITLDLKTLEPRGKRIGLDLANWLDDDLIIRESSFRKKLSEYDFSDAKDAFVALFCTKDAIIPPWSYLLIQTKLYGIAQQVFFL